MYGWKHEKDVKEMYVKTFVKDHRNFKVARSGVVVDMAYLFFCDCCGQGVLQKKSSLNCSATKSPRAAPRGQNAVPRSVTRKLAFLTIATYICNGPCLGMLDIPRIQGLPIATYIKHATKKGMHIATLCI